MSVSTMAYAALGAAIAFEVAGTTLLQKSAQVTRGPLPDLMALHSRLLAMAQLD